jgi:hypothetical protein
MVGEKHKICFSLILLAALLAGCAAAANVETATPAATPVGNRPSVIATGTPTVEAATPAVTSVSKPGGIKVNPPKIPIGGFQRTPASGWGTFTSTTLRVAVDYPTDWSVAENGAEVRFTSPQGSIILLESNESNPNLQDCPTVINAYGQAGDICFDAATSRYRAVFKAPAGAPTAWVVLSTISAGKPVVYLQMFDTLRVLPLMEKPEP